jgi:hypothetical protein
VYPVPDPLLFFSGSAGNRTRASQCSIHLLKDYELDAAVILQIYTNMKSRANTKLIMEWKLKEIKRIKERDVSMCLVFCVCVYVILCVCAFVYVSVCMCVCFLV